VFFAN
jgi:hypothetical protein